MKEEGGACSTSSSQNRCTGAHSVLVRKTDGKSYLEDPGVDGNKT